MTLFSLLFLGHMTGDFLLQTGWMSREKATNLLAGCVHALVYTAACSLWALPAGGLHPVCPLILFVSHLVLDRRSFVLWWCGKVTKSADKDWLVVVTDQSWHFVVLAAVAMLEGGLL